MIGMRSNTVNRIEWADAYFTASANKEPFEEVSIVTAKSMYLELAYTAAVDIMLKQASNVTPSFIQSAMIAYADYIMNEGKVYVHEHVKVADEGISICINAVDVDDEDVVWRALDMLADALRELDGAQGTVYFGDPLRFSCSEISWSVTH